MRIKHKSIVQEIVTEFERLINANELESGRHLPEEAIAAEWGVGRSSVREAFIILEQGGFVEKQPRKGVRVSEITTDRVRDLYDLIGNLESLALRLLIERNPARAVEKLTAINERIEKAADKQDYEDYNRLNQAFHNAIIEEAGNEYLLKFLEPINRLAKRFRAFVLSEKDSISHSLRSHRDIIASIKTGDPIQAEVLRKEYSSQFARLIIDKIEAGRPNVGRHRVKG